MPRPSSRLAAAALAASIGLLGAGCAPPTGAPQLAPTPQVTAPEVVNDAGTPSTTPPDAAEVAAADTGEAAGLPLTDPSAVVVRPATSALVETAPRPVSLDIAGTDINVDVVDVGVEADNEMQIPDSFYEAGWYRYGPAPGAAAGHAVLAAHIDIGTEVMPFTQLKNVPTGTIITVGRDGADPVRYEVTDVRHVPKASLDTAEIFQRDGEHQLVIITCGGDWLADKDDYEDNVVLTASPL